MHLIRLLFKRPLGTNFLSAFAVLPKRALRLLWAGDHGAVGQDMIYTDSEDRIVRVWKKSGVMVRELKGHGHWVNSLAVSTKYCLRAGCWQMGKANEESREEAERRYIALKGKVINSIMSNIIT